MNTASTTTPRTLYKTPGSNWGSVFLSKLEEFLEKNHEIKMKYKTNGY